MRSGISFKITKNKFPELTKDLINRTMAGVELMGMAVERTWKQEARVDTGRYKSSVGHFSDEMVKENSKASPSDPVWIPHMTGAFVQLYVGTNVEYAMSLEARYPNQGGANALKVNEPLLIELINETLGEGFEIL